jgi:hypothetical protein
LAFGFKSFIKGFRIVPTTSTAISQKGDLEVLDSSGKLNYFNGTTASPVVTEAHSSTLTNKTIDGNNNTITNVSTTVANNSVTEAKLTTSVAGDGLTGGNGTPLAVVVDNSTVEINADTVRVKASGITGNELAASVASTGLAGGAGSALSLRPDPKDVRNYSITTSVAANALTIAIKGNNGSDPSATNPVSVAFRNATSASGDSSIVSLTSALSLTISSGSTLGHISGQNEYIYVYLLNNSGSIKLCATTTNSFDNGSIQTTIAEGGVGAADSRTALYSDAVYSSKAVRLVARLKSNQTVAGTWASVISEVSLFPFNDPSKNMSEVWCILASGHGSISTATRLFEASPNRNNGSAITYARSATAGSTFTINEEGVYSINYIDFRSGVGSNFGISVNSDGVTSVTSLGAPTLLAIVFAPSSSGTQCSATMRFYPGDIVRPTTDGTTNDTTFAQFYISKVAP